MVLRLACILNQLSLFLKYHLLSLILREEHEKHLRKKAVELGEDPDKFVTITEKDKLDFSSFRYKMEVDARICVFAKENGEDPNEYMKTKIQERLIGKEIIC